VVDRSIFYPNGGGQPGDRGTIERADGSTLQVETARYTPDRSAIVLVPAAGSALPAVGDSVVQHLDWPIRYRHMRMHTALHLLSVVLPYPVTGGQIGAEESRLDFDLPEGESVDRDAVNAALAALVTADHPVGTSWITDDELLANPSLVKTMKVKPPMGSGRIRLVRIGDIDLQPCGGTHVLSTMEVGEVHVAKVENKGKINRRVRLRFGPPPA